MLRNTTELPHNTQLLTHLLSLSALCHDLGKANAFFQDKLQHNKKARDPYRHEFVSCLILAQVIEQLKPTDDKQWLAEFSNVDNLKTAFVAVLSRADWFDVKTEYRKLPPWQRLRSGAFKKLPLFSSLLWLVLTHHKLPDGDYEEGEYHFICGTAFFGKEETTSDNDKQHAITFESHKEMPWQSNKWLNALADRAKQLQYLLTEQAPALAHQADDLKIAIAHIVRPFLVLGDYQASAAKELYIKPDNNDVCFANTIDGKSADTLVTHLHKVDKQALRCFRVLMGYADNPDFQSIETQKLPPILAQKPQLKNPDSPFHWQDDSCSRIDKEQSNGIQDAGFFGIVAAKTGAGKTVAAARIMAMLSKELRYSLALGLRSLTLQAGKDYEDKARIGFEKNQLAVMVGSKVSQALFEQQQKADIQQDVGDNGTFNEGIAEDDDITYDGDIGNLKDRFPALTDKQLKILATPVLIATVDHIIAPTDGRRSSSTLMSLRLMTSDLVLDEVDSYSYGDLVALGKLVYLSGLYGRKVLLVSATLPPAIAINFYRAYSKGFEQYLRLNSLEKSVFCGWFSDQYQFSQIIECKPELLKLPETIEKYRTKHKAFSTNIAQHLIEQAAQRQAELLNIADCSEPNLLFEQVLQTAFALHSRHHVVDEQTGARVSIGLVRWNNTKPCVAFSRYLLNRDSLANDLPFKIVCYHAKLLPIVLHEIETFCHRALKRQTDQLTQHPDIQNILQNEKPQDLVIIIAATSIIEVGRDFDFDWGIFEPQSTRSIIQTAGRILRHRHKVIDTPNVAVLSTTYRGLFKPTEPAYSYYGIETPALRYRCKLNSKQVTEVFDFTAMQHSINAKWSLLAPETSQPEISYHEHQAYLTYLEQDEQGKALKQWLDKADTHLHGYHSQENIFRDGLYNNGLYLFRQLDVDEDEIRLLSWHWWDREKKRANEYDPSKICPISLRYEKHLLLKINIEQSLLELKNSSSFSNTLLEKLVAIELDHETGTPKFEYHHALGLIRCE